MPFYVTYGSIVDHLGGVLYESVALQGVPMDARRRMAEIETEIEAEIQRRVIAGQNESREEIESELDLDWEKMKERLLAEGYLAPEE